MVLLLVLSWCWAIERLGGGIFPLHSRFVGFNSRFGQHEFLVRAATGIGRKRLDLAGCFHEENRAWPPKTGEIPGFTGETGNSRRRRPTAGAWSRSAMASGAPADAA